MKNEYKRGRNSRRKGEEQNRRKGEELQKETRGQLKKKLSEKEGRKKIRKQVRQIEENDKFQVDRIYYELFIQTALVPCC